MLGGWMSTNKFHPKLKDTFNLQVYLISHKKSLINPDDSQISFFLGGDLRWEDGGNRFSDKLYILVLTTSPMNSFL